MPSSVLEAIKMGLWDFEPQEISGDDFEPTQAVPGSDRKLEVLAERVRLGLPLWHQSDRRDFEGLADDLRPR